jgi:hypothetical protein
MSIIHNSQSEMLKPLLTATFADMKEMFIFRN